MRGGQIYLVTIDVWSTVYYLNEGHRVQVDISSSNYPRFSANPNTGADRRRVFLFVSFPPSFPPIAHESLPVHLGVTPWNPL